MSFIFFVQYSSEEEEETIEDAMSKLGKKRQVLDAVDHDKIYYRPFRKDFYVEVPEIANMTPEGQTCLFTCLFLYTLSYNVI